MADFPRFAPLRMTFRFPFDTLAMIYSAFLLDNPPPLW